MYDVWEEWEYTPKAYCDNYTVHVRHFYTAINGETYDCPGFTEEDDEALRVLESAPPCEHGLSAHLCAGPGHYPPDSDEEHF